MSDVEFSDRIRNLFASKRGAELIQCIADELIYLHSLNQQLSKKISQLHLYQKFMEEVRLLDDPFDRAAQLPSKVSVGAAELFDATNGFYSLEYETDGTPFRWTGPEKRFSLSVNVDRSAPLRVKIDVAHIADKRQREMIVVTDGVSLPMSLVYDARGFTGEVILPAQPVSRTTNLTFVLPCVVKPGNSGEKRQLGIAVREIHLAQALDGEKLLAETAGSVSGIREGSPGKHTGPSNTSLPDNSPAAEPLKSSAPNGSAMGRSEPDDIGRNPESAIAKENIF